MPQLKILRHLVDNQQFAELKMAVTAGLQESGDHRTLPLLALAHAQLDERREAVERAS